MPFRPLDPPEKWGRALDSMCSVFPERLHLHVRFRVLLGIVIYRKLLTLNRLQIG